MLAYLIGGLMRGHIIIIDEKGRHYEGDIELRIKQRHTRLSETPKTTLKKKKPSPSSAITQLYSENFFRNEKKLREVMTKLNSKGFNFNTDSVYRALERSNFLKRQGRKGNYGFIQKFPPS